jgi:hypothetical protein
MDPNDELQEVARRCVWWASPDQILARPGLFLCHVMVYGLWKDVVIIRKRFSKDELRNALRDAPAGLFDLRSWHYWHHVVGLPVPPLPSRQIPGKPPGPVSSKSNFQGAIS